MKSNLAGLINFLVGFIFQKSCHVFEKQNLKKVLKQMFSTVFDIKLRIFETF